MAFLVRHGDDELPERVRDDLELYSSQPMAFPVYGRGRVLYSLVGDGINRQSIAEACAFLVGPSACEIKASNPGSDLLIPLDWDSGLGGRWLEEVRLTSLAALTELSPDENEGFPDASGNFSKENGITRNILLAFGLILVIVAILSYKVLKSDNEKNK